MNKLFTILLLLVTTGSVQASNGVLEINQACAVNTGCFSGDSAGLPVTITQSGSYRLTGNIDQSGGLSSTVIEISASGVTLDLGGFEIRGPTTCTGTPGVDFMCSPVDASLSGIFISADSDGTTVRNGTVRGIPGSAIISDASVMNHVEHMFVTQNGGQGLLLQNQAMVNHVRAFENNQSGIMLGTNALVSHTNSSRNGSSGITTSIGANVSHSVSIENAGRGFFLGAMSKFQSNISQSNSGQDLCGAGLCTERKRYYLTTAFFNASQALSACAAGFHMASAYELINTGTLQYDFILGRTKDDSGFGPGTSLFGWIRTGSNAGADNCLNWTSDNGFDDGRTLVLQEPSGLMDPAFAISPWVTTVLDCDVPALVWCAED